MHTGQCPATNAIRVERVKRAAKAGRAKEWFFALSLANLAMIHVWGVLLYASPTDRYYLPHYGAPDYIAALAILAALTVTVRWLRAASLRTQRPASRFLAQLACAAALFAPLDYLREALGVTRFELLQLLADLPAPVQIATAGVALAGAALALAKGRLVVGAVFFGVLVLAPLAVGNAAQCAWRAIVARDSAIDGFGPAARSASPATDANERRAVWIVFDELDYALAFPDRPASLALPELDRLRRESFFATAAEEAASSTGKAIPSLLLGRPLRTAKPVSESDLEITFDAEPGEPRRLSELDHFAARVRQRGLGLDLLGIYHPYCRLFAGDYRTCHWEPFLPGGAVLLPVDFPSVLLSQLHKLLPLHHRGEHIASIRRTLALGERLTADPSLDVAYIHLPIPHSPHVWDARRARFTRLRFDAGGYRDQLALADRALGRMRRAMEDAGTWERSTLLVTSDHGWRFAESHGRERDHRVPFLLKLAREREPLEYTRRFDAWRAPEVLLRALDGELRTAADVAGWLDSHPDGE